MKVITGVDIGGTDIKIGVVTREGVVEKSGRIPTRPEEGPGAAAVRVQEWLSGQDVAVDEIAAAGVACAGLIDRKKGSIITSPNLEGSRTPSRCRSTWRTTRAQPPSASTEWAREEGRKISPA
jgi:glucokinase